MIDLDLDINHYEMQDLETFFRLVKPYNEHDVAQKEHDIRTLLLSSGHIEPHFKRDLIMFLEEGRNIWSVDFCMGDWFANIKINWGTGCRDVCGDGFNWGWHWCSSDAFLNAFDHRRKLLP